MSAAVSLWYYPQIKKNIRILGELVKHYTRLTKFKTKHRVLSLVILGSVGLDDPWILRVVLWVFSVENQGTQLCACLWLRSVSQHAVWRSMSYTKQQLWAGLVSLSENEGTRLLRTSVLKSSLETFLAHIAPCDKANKMSDCLAFVLFLYVWSF